MAVYGAKKSRATKKARAKKKIKGGTRTASEEPKKVRSRNSRKPQATKKKSSSRAKKSTVAKKLTKKSSSKSHAKKSTAAKKTTSKKKLTAAQQREIRSEAAKKAAKTRKRKRTQAQKEVAKIQRRLRYLRELQQAHRGSGKKSPSRKAVERRRISEERMRGQERIQGVAESAAAEARFRQAEYVRLQTRFDRLFSIAIQTGQTPTKTRLPVKVNSRRFEGEQRRVRVERILKPNDVPEILYKVDQMAGRMSGKYPIWTADLAFSGLGERLFGSGNKVLISNDPDARFFQAQGYDTTGIFGSYQGMRAQLEKELDDYANEVRTTVYLHFVRIRNVDRKRR